MIIISHFPRRINKNLSFLLQKNSLFSPEFLKFFFRIRLLPFSPCGAFLMRRPPLYAFFPSPSHTFPIAAVFLLFPPLLFSLSNRLLYAPSEFSFSGYLPPLRFKLFCSSSLSVFFFLSPLYFSRIPAFFFLYPSYFQFFICRPFKVPYMPPVFPRSPIFAPAVFPPRPPRRVLFPCSLPCGRSSPTRFLKPVLFRYTPAAKIVIAIPKIPRAG